MTFELSKLEQGAIYMYEEGDRGINVLAAIQGATNRAKEQQQTEPAQHYYSRGSISREQIRHLHELGIPRMTVNETLQAAQELRRLGLSDMYMPEV